MNVARVLYPVQVLGPGDRVGIWLCGCTRKCKGCSNPELWERRDEFEVAPEDVFLLIDNVHKTNKIDGFTISGGEPMDQVAELSTLIQMLRSVSDDILVYTGYKLDELWARNDTSTDSVLNSIAVLVDGPYIEELNNDVLLRGSSNQTIHILNDSYLKRYEDYMSCAHNQIQNFTAKDGIVSVGIHHRGFSR
ncbi:MAG: radical SAM protein [Oscillospiraceae bacterium]|nr:radical SAM protein [Oscillospiraceae bacterium]